MVVIVVTVVVVYFLRKRCELPLSALLELEVAEVVADDVDAEASPHPYSS